MRYPPLPVPVLQPTFTPRKRRLRLGFVALADCAPLAMARELGLFKQYGLDVELHRELGWATVRNKIVWGELEASQAPAGLLPSVAFGLGEMASECLCGMVLNSHGNGITLSKDLWKSGVRDGTSLAHWIRACSRPPSFGVVHTFSSHNVLLRQWLRTQGIDPQRDVQILTVPPAQMHAALKGGHLAGYCVGEPWNSMASMAGTGWTVATSAELAPGHPEKVLMVGRSFAQERSQEHLQLIAALCEACRYCQEPANSGHLVEVLSHRTLVNVPAAALRASLGGVYDRGNGQSHPAKGFHVFSGGDCNVPTAERGRWVLKGLLSEGVIQQPPIDVLARVGEWFRPDIFQQAQSLTPAHTP